MDFRILGQLEALQDGDPVELGSPRQRALLARLLLSPNEVVTTDRLVEDLWEGNPPETARHTLHVYISRLRKAMGSEHTRLEHDGLGYRLTVGSDELDATEFERLATEGRAALARGDPATASSLSEDALSLWRGPALADVADEPFAREDAIRLEELRQGTLENRLWADLELGRHGGVVEELQDLVVQHPFRETFWEQLMLALYRGGRQTEALRVYQTLRSNLAAELGIEPGPALQRLEEQILNQDPGLAHSPEDFPDDAPSELPLQRTSFVGRSRELAQGTKLLEGSRLLTLTGAPGSGKTRLALRLATDHRHEYPHGTFFVPLASITNPQLWDTAVARVLGLSEVPGESTLDGLKAFLCRRRVLLVLDNFEQILRVAPQVGQLLDAAPGLTIMVTSRSPLGLSGEQEFPVPPLDVPPTGDPPNLEELAGYDAVTLFVTRASASEPNFELNAGNAAAVAAITVRLDGLPLAIELAAARVKLLTPQELQARLDRRLTLLTAGPADTDDRHRTMRDAIAWSYELLEPEEQELFRTLGVFLGGFTIEAAGAVGDLTETQALDRVGSLLSRSLLYRPVDVGRARFTMLETTREFALEELANAGKERESAGRHARYFLDLAEEIEPQLLREPGGTGEQWLGAESDNLRGALAYSLQAGEPDLGLRLASTIWRFWQSSDQLTEGRNWLERLLGRQEASDEARADGLTAIAGLAYWQADYDEAWERYSEALSLYQGQGNQFNEADTLYCMSLTANWRGDVDTGERLGENARALFEQVGSREGVGRALMAQGFSMWRRNELAAAEQLYEQSLAIARESGDQSLANTLLLGIAILTFRQGKPKQALRIVLEAVKEATDLQNAHVTVWMLDFVAAFAASTEPDAAVRLAGAVDSLRRDAGGGILPASLDVEDARTVAARLLNSERLDKAWAQGREASLEEAVDWAVELGSLVRSKST